MKTSLMLLLSLGIAATQAGATTVIEMKIDGTIHSGTTAMIQAAIEKVKEQKAEALLIELDTPGGMLDATRDIVKLFLNTDVPIFVYVAPSGAHAGSAGTFITMAAHVAGMAPGTNIGAAHPVSATGSDPEKDGGKHLAKKIENDTSSFIGTIAIQRGRNAEWAKKAVIDSAVINETEAVKLNVVDFVAKDKADFLAQADGKKVKTASGEKILKTKGATLMAAEIDFSTKAKNALANPAVMFVLLLIAGAGFYIEMSHPGLIFPAVVGGIAALLLLIATSIIPMSLVGIGLIVAAFALMIAELYITSFGLLAAAGIVAFVIGAYLLFDPAHSDLRVPRGLIWGTASGLGAVAIFIGIAVGRTLKAKQTAGMEGLIGMVGRVEEPITPDHDGKIFVSGEHWNATAKEAIEVGKKVEIQEIIGLLAHVKQIS